MPTININHTAIVNLDITPAQLVIQKIIDKVSDEPIKFKIFYDRDRSDPRELSEISEVRLWFIRLDAAYPWLPYILDWREGELGRYAAMLVPHEFRQTTGIEFNFEALQIFVMQKIFVISNWLKSQGIDSTEKLQQMTQVLGYEIDKEFFNFL
jgi:hypothetical protein